jgi:hypothetical protein
MALVAAPLTAQNSALTEPLLVRRYVEGSRLQYVMTGENRGSRYQVRIDAEVKKAVDGMLVDEFAWSDLLRDGVAQPLSPAARDLRAAVTLSGGQPFVMPDLSRATGLVGPITDLLTFYADLFLAMHQGSLRAPGDRFRFSQAEPASWADGRVVILGQDHIDFDILLEAVNPAEKTARLLVKHVPPAEPRIALPADWMQTPVADTPNNWVQVRKTATGYVASVGKETFDVALTVDLADGKILTATMDNPVVAIDRECADAALTQCGEAKPDRLVRRIQMSLVTP